MESSDAGINLLLQFTRQTARFTQFTKVREFQTTHAEWLGCRYRGFVNPGGWAIGSS